MSLLVRISLRTNSKPSKFLNNYSTLRTFSSKTISVTDKSDQEPIDRFKEIYRFQYIKLGFALNKFKWPQTMLTACVIPSCAALHFSGVLDQDLAIGIIFSVAVLTANMYAYGSLFHKAVGFMYLSEDESTVKISYMDFWGDRINKEVPVEDVMPLGDSPSVPTDYVYRTIHLYSADKLKLKLFLNTGGKITDEVKFSRVFGDFKKY